MDGFFIGEDGPHAGIVIDFTEGTEWILGRDPDSCTFVLEDPMVSRKHVKISKEQDLFIMENLSHVNPIQVNGKSLTEGTTHTLQEQDTIQIGNNFFRFSHEPPREQEAPVADMQTDHVDDTDQLGHLGFTQRPSSRFMIKVLSGPNQGAEFGLEKNQSYILGKDPEQVDVLFQDLSVSRTHAKISLDDQGNAFIEDLKSKNGVYVNNTQIQGLQPLQSQDLISIGTTSFLFIDQEKMQETIYAPAMQAGVQEEALSETDVDQPRVEQAVDVAKSWRDVMISKKQLVYLAAIVLVVCVGSIGLISLFKGSQIIVEKIDATPLIEETLKPFPSVQYTFNSDTGKIFLVGHVLTQTDYNELMYLISGLTFIHSIADNVVVDEGVWESMNALLMQNPQWKGVRISATEPGRFVAQGYLENEEEWNSLDDYLNLHFPYLNFLENHVVVDSTLEMQIQNMLTEENFVNITFQLNNGEVILGGRVNRKQETEFSHLIDHLKDIPGVRQVKNFAIYTDESTLRIDLSQKYKVTGVSKFGNRNHYVLIDGKILTKGDVLEGMVITEITPTQVDLEKDGMKYKIDYNLH